MHTINIHDQKHYIGRTANLSFWKNIVNCRWEFDSLSLLKDFFWYDKQKAPQVFIDIGAWEGPYTLYAADMCDRIISIEPDPAAYDLLVSNIELLKNADTTDELAQITVVNEALHNKSEKMGITCPRQGKGAGETQVYPESTGTIYGIRLVDLCQQLDVQLQHISVIKIDIEGWEGVIIDDLMTTIDRTRTAVLLALHPWILHNQDNGNLLDWLQHFRYVNNHEYVDVDKIRESIDLVHHISPSVFYCPKERYDRYYDEISQH